MNNSFLSKYNEIKEKLEKIKKRKSELQNFNFIIKKDESSLDVNKYTNIETKIEDSNVEVNKDASIKTKTEDLNEGKEKTETINDLKMDYKINRGIFTAMKIFKSKNLAFPKSERIVFKRTKRKNIRKKSKIRKI